MKQDAPSKPRSKLNAWCRKWLVDVILLLIILSMIVWIICLAKSNMPDKPSWLLVPVTVIYSVFTLWMAGASAQNAVAARRSAEAMEASVEEQRQSRWAAFGAIISFPDGYKYRVDQANNWSITLGNPYRQPMLRVWARMWLTEGPGAAEGQLKYSTLMESAPIDVPADSPGFSLFLKPTTQAEAARISAGNAALERYREVYGGALPKSALVAILYEHRARLGSTVLVYDFERMQEQVEAK